MSRKKDIERIISSRPEIIPIDSARRALEKRGAGALYNLANNPAQQPAFWEKVIKENGFRPTPVALPPVPQITPRRIFKRKDVPPHPSWTSLVAALNKVSAREIARA